MAGEEKKRVVVENGGGTPHPRCFFAKSAEVVDSERVAKINGSKSAQKYRGQGVKVLLFVHDKKECARV